MKNVVVGTAGHIDHGKSQLVKALTGIDPDRLKEEKERGITIDIGFAFLPLGEGLRLGFVDVPGHERFVKNMLAGIGGIDLVLLVVAADESVMPQTREHFAICSLLGVERGVVALTKVDLAEPEMIELVELEVREFLAGSFLENAPLVRVSARSGEGLEALREVLAAEAAQVRARSEEALFRLPVDRAFTIRGFGTVVTGTLRSGRIAVGEEVEIYPIGRRARIRGLEVHGEKTESAGAGQRTAINLHGVDLEEVERGHVLGRPETFRPKRLLDVQAELLPTAGRPLADGARVRFHLGTAEIMARVGLLADAEPRRLDPGGEQPAQLLLEQPTVALPGDRFILRQYSPVLTIGGGTVLDNLPRRHRRRDREGVRTLLQGLAGSAPEERIRLLAGGAGLRGLTDAEAAVRCGLHRQEAAALMQSLAGAGEMVRIAENPLTLCPASQCRELKAKIGRLLEAYHERHPLKGSMPREELRRRSGAGEGVFRLVLSELAAAGRVRAEANEVTLAGHQVVLTAEEERVRAALLETYARSPFAPPAVEEALATAGGEPATAEKIFHLLAREGELARVSVDLAFTRGAMEEVKERLRQLKAGGKEEVSVGDFKELFGITRKYAIPLLEYLDKSRFTRRIGDRRVIQG